MIPILALHRPDGAAFSFLALFAVVLAGPAIVARARIPGIIGLLLGGWAIGPHGLGLIGQGNQTVPELGHLGLLYLMFVAGLELDLGVLRVYRRRAGAFGLAAFALPFVCGVVAGQILGFAAAAAVLTGALAASHTLITYPLVRDAGLGRHPAVAAAVGATVLTDTLALIVLAVVSGTQTGSGSMAVVLLELALGFAVLGLFSFVLLPRGAMWAIRRSGADRSVRFLVALIAFLTAATIAQMFDIEGIVGAFFAGLALNHLVPNEGQTMHQIDFFGSSVFVPIFLVSTGLLLDPTVMFELETLKFAALFIVACLGGKALAALFAHVVLKVAWPDAVLMWVVSIPQAAATLAATTVGFEIGLFSITVVNAVLVLILVSIITSTVLVPVVIQHVEAPDAGSPPLGERVVLALHGEHPSPATAQLAARLARHDGGVVETLLVRHTDEGRVDRRPLHGLSRVAAREGFDGNIHFAVDRSTAHAVLHGATDLGASIVVVETDFDSEESRFALGNWEEALAATITVPLVLVTAGGAEIKRIVRAPIDCEEIDDRVVAFIDQLARTTGQGEAVPVDGTGPDWNSDLLPGDLAFVAVPTFELIMGLPKAPPGAAIAAVPIATLARSGE